MAQATQGSPPPAGDNSKSRFEIANEALTRLTEIKELKKKLSREAEEIIDTLEKNSGVNRGALAEVRKMLDLSPAAIQARESSRAELMEWFVKPKLEEAEAGQKDE